jgi:hypothetical protein
MVVVPRLYRIGRASFIALLWFVGATWSQVSAEPTPEPTESPVSLAFPNSNLQDVLHTYAFISKRKVWMQLGVRAANVSISSERPIPRQDALALIRKVLLERHGIELRDAGDDETFVSWTTNPAYERLIPTGASQPRVRVRGRPNSGSPAPTP